jgi:diguanylate cyclase (GGDEF)-like protein/PAS domain S-box-containing protein
MITYEGKSRADLIGELEKLLERVNHMELAGQECHELISELREREQRYRVLLDDSSDPIFSFDREGRYLYINRAFAAPFKRDPEEIIGKKIWDVFSQDEADKRFAAVKAVFASGETRVIEVRVPTAEKDLFFITTVKPIFDIAGEVSTVICISKEITERKHMEEELRHLSSHDLLTGLYNRNFFEVELERIQKSRNISVTILLMDLDGLKSTNDRLGHQVGDELLKRVAAHLKEVFRSSDIVARIGGDEFAVLLPDTDPASAQSLLGRLREKFAASKEEGLSVSIGTANNTDTYLLSDVMREADDLMYREKELHKRSI